MRKLILVLLVLALCAPCAALAGGTYYYELGDTIEDFTVTDCSGNQLSLYEALSGKQMVLINIWATWCGPCRSEFPFLEQAYEKYSDRVAVLALSSEPTDDDAKLKSFAAEYGLTFFVGRDTAELANRFNVTGIPTSVAVDRAGTISFIETGAMPDAASFERLFDALTADDYVPGTVFSEIPQAKPDIEKLSAAELAAALDAGDSDMRFSNGKSAYDWPMAVSDTDGRTALVSTNTGVNSSVSVLNVALASNAGDAFAICFKTDTEVGCDLLRLQVNGKTVKSFGGSRDWTSYVYRFESGGEYEISIKYEKDAREAAGEDRVWIDSVKLLSGADAQAALAANPVYPVSESTYIRIVNENARKININDPTGIIEAYLGTEYYLVGDDEAIFELGLTEDYDPECAYVYCDYDNSVLGLIDLMSGDSYMGSCPGDSIEETGYAESTLYFLYDGSNYIMATYFKTESDVDALVAQLTADESGKVLGSWTYADEGETKTAPGGKSVYTVKYTDQNGAPVAGVICKVCDDATCQLFTSDENGLCAFELEPFAWEIHTLMVPAGYSGDTEKVTYADPQGGVYLFTLTKQ